jgi:hypothetical protein
MSSNINITHLANLCSYNKSIFFNYIYNYIRKGLLMKKVPSPSSPNSPSVSKAVSRRNPPRARRKVVSERSPSPSNGAKRRSPSPSNVAKRRSPSPSNVAKRRSPSPSNVAKRRSPSSSNVAKRRSPSPSNGAKRRSPSPSNGAKRRSKVPQLNKDDPYSTPFWPPSDYSVPAKIITKDPNPLPRTLAKHRLFIEELKNVLNNEKIIDRENPLFKGLLAEQQKWNHIFHNLKPYNIICFVICDYHLYDKNAPRVFHKNNEEPFFGNFKFKKLLKNNNMSMKWYGNNILYIHKNRF